MSLEFNTLIKRLFFNWHVKILSVSAAVLLFVFNRMINLDENVLTVPLELRLHEDFSAATLLPHDTVNVTIRGDKELEIRKIGIDDITVFADLTPFSREDTYMVKLQYEKKGIAATLSPISVSLDPPEIKMAIEKTSQKSARIEATIKAGPPDGYDYSYSLIPGAVAISGPKTLIDTIQIVKTDAIDLAGKTENFSVPVKLVPPDRLIRFRETNQVEFQCIINQVIVEKTVEAKVKIVNLTGKLRLESRMLEAGSLSMKISPEKLETLEPNDISLLVDCTNIKVAGRYVIKVKPIVPEGVVAVRYSPEEVVLEISGY
jgi:YbbR domain-containing protein